MWAKWKQSYYSFPFASSFCIPFYLIHNAKLDIISCAGSSIPLSYSFIHHFTSFPNPMAVHFHSLLFAFTSAIKLINSRFSCFAHWYIYTNFNIPSYYPFHIRNILQIAPFKCVILFHSQITTWIVTYCSMTHIHNGESQFIFDAISMFTICKRDPIDH